jgi:hypothetical protein
MADATCTVAPKSPPKAERRKNVDRSAAIRRQILEAMASRALAINTFT